MSKKKKLLQCHESFEGKKFLNILSPYEQVSRTFSFSGSFLAYSTTTGTRTQVLIENKFFFKTALAFSYGGQEEFSDKKRVNNLVTLLL